MATPKDRTPKKITKRIEKFCLLLIGGISQEDAYRASFSVSPKATKASVKQTAHKLANAPIVKARLDELMAPVVAKVQLSRERWLQELIDCALFDPRELFDSHGNCLEVKDLSDRAARAIASFDQVENFEGKGESLRATGYTRKFKLVDKLKALELVGKACKFYEEADSDNSKIPRSLTLTFVDKRSPFAPQPAVTAEVVPIPKVKFVTSR